MGIDDLSLTSEHRAEQKTILCYLFIKYNNASILRENKILANEKKNDSSFIL